MNTEKLNKAIFQGIENACWESVMFRGFAYPDIKPEYLLTVNIAQAICHEFRGDVLIALEEQTEIYKGNLFNKANLMDYMAFIKAARITRNGLIGIALYDKSGRSVCPIEVKGFTESLYESYFDKIYKDIERNLQFLSYDTETHSISQAVSTFILQDKECIIAHQKTQSINKIIKNCKDFIDNRLSFWATNFTFNVEAQTVYENLFESDEHLNGYSEEDVHAEIIEKLHYVGVIINITKRLVIFT